MVSSISKFVLEWQLTLSISKNHWPASHASPSSMQYMLTRMHLILPQISILKYVVWYFYKNCKIIIQYLKRIYINEYVSNRLHIQIASYELDFHVAARLYRIVVPFIEFTVRKIKGSQLYHHLLNYISFFRKSWSLDYHNGSRSQMQKTWSLSTWHERLRKKRPFKMRKPMHKMNTGMEIWEMIICLRMCAKCQLVSVQKVCEKVSSSSLTWTVGRFIPLFAYISVTLIT